MGGGDKGFVKVLLGSYFYIILPINAVFAVGIWRQMIYVFMVFYGRYPSGQVLSGGAPGGGRGPWGALLTKCRLGGRLPMFVCPGHNGLCFLTLVHFLGAPRPLYKCVDNLLLQLLFVNKRHISC